MVWPAHVIISSRDDYSTAQFGFFTTWHIIIFKLVDVRLDVRVLVLFTYKKEDAIQ